MAKCDAQGWSDESVRVWTASGPVFVPQGDPRVGTIPLGASIEIDFEAVTSESNEAATLVADAREISRRQAEQDAWAEQNRIAYEKAASAHRGEAAAIDELMQAAD